MFTTAVKVIVKDGFLKLVSFILSYETKTILVRFCKHNTLPLCCCCEWLLMLHLLTGLILLISDIILIMHPVQHVK